MVAERAVLLGSRTSGSAAAGSAPKIHRHFIDFIEQKDPVVRSGIFDPLDGPAGHGSYVCAAMSADFRFIAHAAERVGSNLRLKAAGDRTGQ